MSREMTVGIDYTSRDYRSIKADMIKLLRRKIPEYTDTSETDAGIVILECLAIGCDIVSFYQDAQANETNLYTCEQRQNALLWCKMFGYVPQPTYPAHVNVVFELNSVNNTLDTKIPKGTVVKTEATEKETSIMFTTEEDLIIPQGELGDEQDGGGKYKYFVSAVQGVPIVGDILGKSNGKKDQRFNFSYSPVFLDSIKLEVYEADRWVEWRKVSSFSESNYLSRHYQIFVEDDNTVYALFGDGNTGMIPPPYQIRASYINGGGTDGNIAAGKISSLHTSISAVKRAFNPEEVYKRGMIKESLDSIKINAPAYLRTKWGALTETDFGALAKLAFPEVLYSQGVKDPDHIDDMFVYIMFRDGISDPAKLEEIHKFLDERKIVGADKITVKPMEVDNIDITASLVVDSEYYRDRVKKYVEDYLKDFFAVGSLRVSEDVSFTDIEAKVYKNIRGIQAFRITSPAELVHSVPDGKVARLRNCVVNATGGVVSG